MISEKPIAHIKSLPDNKPVSRTILAAVILTLLAGLVYANMLNAPFVFDDRLNINQNYHIRMTAITVDNIANVFKSPGKRFIADLSMALNYYFHRYNVRGFHTVNLIIHLLTALLTFLVARITLQLCAIENDLIPFLAAALWLVNPVHTQSVTYTIQRMNSLATMFYMLALFCYIRARINFIKGKRPLKRYFLYILCLMAGLLGLGSKEITATLPVILFLYEWYFFQNLDGAWLKKRLFRISLIIIIIILLGVIYIGVDPVSQILSMYAENKRFTPVQRLLTEPAVVVYYISLLLFPHPKRLMLLYDFPLSRSILTPLTTLAAILALCALIVCGVLLSRKERLLSFAVFWFLTNLLIESSVFGLALVFEHRTYLPSIFPFIALTAMWMRQQRFRILSLALPVALILLWGIWTYQRNTTWNDRVLFWRDNADKSPHLAKVNNNLGQALLEQDELKSATEYLKIALNQDPTLEASRVNLGVALQRQGQIPQAIAQYKKVLAENPDNIDARYNLAMLLKEQGETGFSVAQLKKIVKLAPHNSEALLNLGILMMEEQKNDQALFWFEKAAAVDPGDTRVLNNLGIVWQRLGKTDKAISVYQRGLAIDGRNPFLHNSLGLALMSSNRFAEAAGHFKLALATDPGLVEAYNNLGLIAEQRRNTDAAIDYYRQAIQIDPAYDLARYNLAVRLLKKGLTDQAMSLLQKINRVKKEHWPALNRLFIALVEAKELPRAITLAEAMAAAAPRDASVHYNLACLYARQNNLEKAVSHLKQSLALGYDRWDHLKNDPDLKILNHTDYYRQLIHGHKHRNNDKQP